MTQNLLLDVYTVFQKNVSPLMFDNNFGKCGPIFTIFHQMIRKKISMYISQRFPPHLRYVATLPHESRKSKNVTKFSR